MEEEDDTLIGNYESEIIETEDDATTSELDSVMSFEPGYLVAKMCVNYANNNR